MYCTCVVVDLVPHPQLLGDWIKDFAGAVGIVLAHGRRVVVYSGKDDFICNYFGGDAWTKATQWSQAVSHVDHCTCMYVHQFPYCNRIVRLKYARTYSRSTLPYPSYGTLEFFLAVTDLLIMYELGNALNRQRLGVYRDMVWSNLALVLPYRSYASSQKSSNPASKMKIRSYIVTFSNFASLAVTFPPGLLYFGVTALALATCS